MITWQRQGCVYAPSGGQGWRASKAMLPTSLLRGDRIRVYVGMCDPAGVGRVGWVDLDAANPTHVVAEASAPVLDIGEPGTFDDNGVVPVSVIDVGGAIRLYYAGFQLGVKRPYTMFTGVAVSDDGGDSFTRLQSVPVLDRTDGELFFRSGTHVQRVDNRWHAWYAGGSGWSHHEGKPLPIYDLLHLESDDGIIWPTRGDLCMPRGADERGFGRPAVLDGERMWMSVRAHDGSYRMSHARSVDGGRTWTRDDREAGIAPAAAGWDAEMVAYPCLQRVGDALYLLYNGNGYGRTGFGIARASFD